jgi:uncharacterized phage protein (TIGR02218 family)
VLVKVTRVDGTVLGFTDSDQPVVFGGVTYKPDQGIKMSALSVSLGSSVDNTNVEGGFSADIPDTDLAAGKYAGAVCVVSVVNLDSLGDGNLILATYDFGQIEITDNGFQIELRGILGRLKQTIGELTSKKCQCSRLGDARCKINLATATVAGRSVKVTRTVGAVASQKQFDVASESAPSTFYTYGHVKFTSGLNAGIERDVKTHTLVSGSGRIEVREPFPFAVAVGDTCELIAGCNKKMKYDPPYDVSGNPTLETPIAHTCKEFGNIVNFRGFHFLPGNDRLSQYGRN